MPLTVFSASDAARALLPRQGHIDFRMKTQCVWLNRPLGAILKDHLRLVAVPRGSGRDRLRYANYCFTLDGEERLTAWIRDNLEVGICPLDARDADLRAIEANLIADLTPGLCLAKWPNPLAGYIRELRRQCADEARRAQN